MVVTRSYARFIFFSVLLAITALRGPAVLETAWNNAGLIVLSEGLVNAGVSPSSYPYPNTLVDRVEGLCIKALLRRTVSVHGEIPAHWGLAWAALAAGEADTAAKALAPLSNQTVHNPFLYADTLAAFSYGEEPEKVIALHEGIPPSWFTPIMSDMVALAYMEQAYESPKALKKALELRPGDLYVNYHLWRQAVIAGDSQAAAVYSETLVYFPLEAIHPTDERLLDYAAEVILNLVEEGLWDWDKTLNVVSFLVWQYNGAAGVEWLLQNLIARYPADPAWLFYLGELYQRRGDLDRAEVAYRRVLKIDPEYTQAYLQLGILNEARISETTDGEWLEAAARWYHQYHELVPDDLLGLKKLAGMYEALEEQNMLSEAKRAELATLRKELEAKTDDRCIVAEMLDVSVEDVELGPNLIANSGFEEWSSGLPRGWGWNDNSKEGIRNNGLCIGGIDSSYEGSSVRVSAIWWYQSAESKKPGRCGWGLRKTSDVPLQANEIYALSFSYRTEQLADETSGVWIGKRETLTPDNVGLPATHGAWRRFVIVGRNRLELGSHIRPLLLRNFSFDSGSVRFDNVEFRRVDLNRSVSLAESKTRLVGERVDR